jgi:hypothetical protein
MWKILVGFFYGSFAGIGRSVCLVASVSNLLFVIEIEFIVICVDLDC